MVTAQNINPYKKGMERRPIQEPVRLSYRVVWEDPTNIDGVDLDIFVSRGTKLLESYHNEI